MHFGLWTRTRYPFNIQSILRKPFWMQKMGYRKIVRKMVQWSACTLLRLEYAQFYTNKQSYENTNALYNVMSINFILTDSRTTSDFEDTKFIWIQKPNKSHHLGASTLGWTVVKPHADLVCSGEDTFCCRMSWRWSASTSSLVRSRVDPINGGFLISYKTIMIKLWRSKELL